MSFLGLFCVAYHSSVTKVTTLPGHIVAKYYTTTTKELNLQPNIIPFHQHQGIFHQLQLVKNIRIFASYLSHHLYNIENNETYNKYKWRTLEKSVMTNASNWIDKKPASITARDLIVLSFLMKTRSLV
ncbi:hypothetical protein MFLAVUS_000259 [Mucor flavus]|uniref:Uncharacterized protein n=1 Tax=Mucor flavus TaxID=439312 RepID=A0ABP9YJ98_9FUNG